MNDELPATVGQLSAEGLHKGVQKLCRESAVGLDTRKTETGPSLRGAEVGGLGERFEPIPIAGITAAVIAVHERILSAGYILSARSEVESAGYLSWTFRS